MVQSQVLLHNVLLDLRDVFLSFFDCVLSEVIKQLSVVCIDLLLQTDTIFSSLLLDLVLETEEHLVAVCLVLDLLLFDELCVFEL